MVVRRADAPGVTVLTGRPQVGPSSGRGLPEPRLIRRLGAGAVQEAQGVTPAGHMVPRWRAFGIGQVATGNRTWAP